MRILVCHNFYQQPGGEDEVFASEVALLRLHGHDVTTFQLDNDVVNDMGRAAMLAATLWNRKTYQTLRQRVAEDRAEVVHFHNTFPLISPAAYYAARREGAAVVQTLHNFRLLCPGANLFRQGKVCEDCIGRHLPWPGVVHKCYRESRSASAAVAALIAAHHVSGTWKNAVDLYLAPTEFARKKFVAGGLPADKLMVKPNFVDPDPGIGAGDGGFALFVARLSNEKGIETLLQAWEKLDRPIPLKVIGDGPMAPVVDEACQRMKHIEWLGRRPLADVYETMGRASVLIFPSRCYETFGRVAVEAYAKGTPVIASGHGAPGDIVRPGKTGTLFEPGNAAALAEAVQRMLSDPARLATQRIAARMEYEARYTGLANLAQLMEAYRTAIAASHALQKSGQAHKTPIPLRIFGQPLHDDSMTSAEPSPQAMPASSSPRRKLRA